MRGIIINPYDRTITETVTDGSNQAIKWALDRDPQYSGLFAIVRLNDEGDVLFVDDEGLLNEGRPVFNLVGSARTISLAGVAFILGTDEDTDESQSAVITLAEAEAFIQWTDLETTGEFGEARSYQRHDGMFVYEGGKPIFRTKKP